MPLMSAEATSELGHEIPVVIFDGVCNLCNRFVDFLIRKDKEGRLRFVSNQSETGQRLSQGRYEQGQDPGTVYLAYKGKIHTRSGAALRMLRLLGFPWSLFFGLMIVPWFIRDFFYKLIARNRYRWFGKRETCRLPSPEERGRFLD